MRVTARASRFLAILILFAVPTFSSAMAAENPDGTGKPSDPHPTTGPIVIKAVKPVNDPMSSIPRWSFSFDGGGACMPGILFSLDDSVKKHPDRLCGYAISPTIGYRISKTVSLHVTFFKENVHGNGPWARDTGDPKEAQMQAFGVASGRTDMRLIGPVFTARKTFRPTKRLQPFIEAGGGVGWLSVKFRGSFTGMDEEGDTFTEPAQDKVSQRIPLVQAGGGATFALNRQNSFMIGYRWNTSNVIYLGFKTDPAPIVNMFTPGHGKKK